MYVPLGNHCLQYFMRTACYKRRAASKSSSSKGMVVQRELLLYHKDLEVLPNIGDGFGTFLSPKLSSLYILATQWHLLISTLPLTMHTTAVALHLPSVSGSMVLLSLDSSVNISLLSLGSTLLINGLITYMNWYSLLGIFNFLHEKYEFYHCYTSIQMIPSR